jgi:peptidoglycan/xylan/chitin deacetylase (PgdA/CDA1 family)
MSIQSHSYSHRYLTSLSPRELRDELARSKGEIEQHVGTPVTLLAPPGGRMPRALGDLARELGYRYVLSSRPGAIRRRDSDAVLPRMAVTQHLDEPTLKAWLDGDARTMLTAQTRYAVLAGLKRVLGDQRYERMRSRVLGGNAEA